jgi:hypothetical protein
VDEQEARALLDAEIAKVRGRPYADLLRLVDGVEDYWVTGPSGKRYGVEVNFFWDHGKRGNGDIRVIASIDDGGPSAQRPLSDCHCPAFFSDSEQYPGQFAASVRGATASA